MSKFKAIIAFMAIGLFVGATAEAGRYHVNSGTMKDGTWLTSTSDGVTAEMKTLICYDCHSMHASDTLGSTLTDPYADGRSFYASATEGDPKEFLLKGTISGVCLACHDGTNAAVPDVMNTDANSTTGGRSAGALNDGSGTGGYQSYMGHTIGSVATPPGYDATKLGGPGTSQGWYMQKFATEGLQCISCHYQHGRRDFYRNLPGPKSGYTDAALYWGTGGGSGWQGQSNVSYKIAAAPDSTKNVWINSANITNGDQYVGGTGTPDFDYYSFASIRYMRNDSTFNPKFATDATGTDTAGAASGISQKSSNDMANFCANCHVNLHGGGGDTNIGITQGTTGGGSGYEGFLRHPTGQTEVGQHGAGRWSSTKNYTSVTSQKVHSNAVWTAWDTYDASGIKPTPFCLTCHKAHGNKNPFGLFFLRANSAPGTNTAGAGKTADEGSELDAAGDIEKDYVNLCGQCHNTQSG